MLPEFNKVKGVHPGAVLKRELLKRSVKAIELATSIGEYPQTINALTKEKRGINPKLSIKLGEYFNIDTAYFMLLQASYEVETALQQIIHHPFTINVRSSVFWDTDVTKLDTEKNRTFIIQRILERGNKREIEELIKLYGKEVIKQVSKQINNVMSANFKFNAEKYILDEV